MPSRKNPFFKDVNQTTLTQNWEEQAARQAAAASAAKAGTPSTGSSSEGDDDGDDDIDDEAPLANMLLKSSNVSSRTKKAPSANEKRTPATAPKKMSTASSAATANKDQRPRPVSAASCRGTSDGKPVSAARARLAETFGGRDTFLDVQEKEALGMYTPQLDFQKKKAESAGGDSKQPAAKSVFKWDMPFVLVDLLNGTHMLMQERDGDIYTHDPAEGEMMDANFQPRERDVNVAEPRFVLVDTRTGRRLLLQEKRVCPEINENAVDKNEAHRRSLEYMKDCMIDLDKMACSSELLDLKMQVKQMADEMEAYRRIDRAVARTKQELHKQITTHLKQFPNVTLKEKKERLVHANQFRFQQLLETVYVLERERDDKKRCAKIAKERTRPFVDVGAGTVADSLIYVPPSEPVPPKFVSSEPLEHTEQAMRKLLFVQHSKEMGERPFAGVSDAQLTQSQRDHIAEWDWYLSYEVESCMLCSHAPEAHMAEMDRKEDEYQRWCKLPATRRRWLREHYVPHCGPLFYKDSNLPVQEKATRPGQDLDNEGYLEGEDYWDLYSRALHFGDKKAAAFYTIMETKHNEAINEFQQRWDPKERCLKKPSDIASSKRQRQEG